MIIDCQQVWTISNRYFAGAAHYSPTAIDTARRVFGYNGTDADFDFGLVRASVVWCIWYASSSILRYCTGLWRY
eukprot:SAG31_NODE_642_length_13301_cov_14.143084_20_plen_74_part_00